MVELFNDGGIMMWPILILFIFGLLVTLERIYTLTKSTIVTKSFIPEMNRTLREDGVDAALELCENTPGPIAEIFHAGLSRYKYGVEAVEKAISNAGTVEMAFLERGMIWLSTVIVLAPMLGFAGTVAGMVVAFQDIEAANNISPAVVAGGISQALLTTLFGLIVAMIIQFFYNIFQSRVDSIVVNMEESSINLIDSISYDQGKEK